jgi:hypothetical protein
MINASNAALIPPQGLSAPKETCLGVATEPRP